MRGTGVVIAAAGIALTFLAQISMGTEWRIGIDTTEATGLVTDGAFTIARNPIFSAMLITAAGLTLMVSQPDLDHRAGRGSRSPSSCRFVASKNHTFAKQHGPAYADYEARVGRFLPSVGRSAPLAAPQSTDAARDPQVKP